PLRPRRRPFPYTTLFRSEQLGDLAVALLQRAAQQLLLGLELAEPRLDTSQLAFALLDQPGGLEKAGIDPLALGVDLVGILGKPRSEEHTSELQSRENLVC